MNFEFASFPLAPTNIQLHSSQFYSTPSEESNWPNLGRAKFGQWKHTAVVSARGSSAGWLVATRNIKMYIKRRGAAGATQRAVNE